MQPIKSPVARFFLYLVLSVFAVYSSIPFVWATLQSLKTVRQLNSRTPLFIFKPTFENYTNHWLASVPENLPGLVLGLLAVVLVLILIAMLLQRLRVPKVIIWLGLLGALTLIFWAIPQIVDTAEFYDFFVNSVIVTTGTVIISISIACLAGYALARYSGIDGVIVLVAALAFRALPRMAFALPYFWLGHKTGLHDTYLLVILVLVAVNQPFAIWMLRSFFMDIPREIEESAMVDGASRLEAFWKVIIPIMWPGIISTALFTVLLAYEEFLLVRVLAQTNWTLTVAMAQFVGSEYSSHSTLPYAGAVSATIPLLLVILFFQEKLVKGLTAGAVKG